MLHTAPNPFLDSAFSSPSANQSTSFSSRNPLLTRDLSQFSYFQGNNTQYGNSTANTPQTKPKKRRLPSTTPPLKRCLHLPAKTKRMHWNRAQQSAVRDDDVIEVVDKTENAVQKVQRDRASSKRMPSPTPPIRGLGLSGDAAKPKRAVSVQELARHRVELMRRVSQTPQREKTVRWSQNTEQSDEQRGGARRPRSAMPSGGITTTRHDSILKNSSRMIPRDQLNSSSSRIHNESQIPTPKSPARATQSARNASSTNRRSSSRLHTDTYAKPQHLDATSVLTPSKHTLQKLTELNVEQAEIVTWIREQLGVELPQVVGSHDNPMIADPRTDLGLSDGVKLAEIVGRLENTVIRGIDKNPTKTAAVIHNINKSLELLRQRKNMNPTYLWATKEIAAGQYDVIWGLLYDLYQEYGKTFQKKYSRKKSAHKKRMDNILLKSSMKLSKSRNKLLDSSLDSSVGAASSRKKKRSKTPQNSHDVMTHNTEVNMDATLADPDQICTPTMEKVARSWLHDINFDTWLTSENRVDDIATLQDVLRNGVFLCKLLSSLEGKKISGVIKQPLIISQAIQNTDTALQVLREKNTNIPKFYLYSSQKLVQGDKKMFWGLLHHIMKTYPSAKSNYQKHYSGKQRSIYSAEDMHRLEMSVLFWLSSLGLLRDITTDGQPPQSIEDVMPEIQNGRILCDLCAVMNGSPIQGVFDKPRVKATKLSNITKALEFLRRQKGMATTFLFSENEILNGDKNMILGLFEDIHRLYDKVAPKIQHDIRKEDRGKPYLGKNVSLQLLEDFFAPSHHKTSHQEGLNSAIKKSRDKSYSQDPALVAYMFGPNALNGTHNTILNGTSRSTRHSKNASSNVLLNGSLDQDNTGIRSSTLPVPATPPTEYRVSMPAPSTQSTVDQRVFPEPFFPSSYLSNVLLPSPSQLNASVNALYNSGMNNTMHSNISMDQTTLRNTRINATANARHNSTAHQSNTMMMNDTTRGTTNLQRTDINKPSQGFLLGKWLESIGIKLKSPFALEGPSVHLFSDGLFLCEIVGKLEHAEIKGVTKNAQARAACLHNIKKALSVLRKKKSMPIDLLWSDDEIYKGNGDVIRTLLEQIRKAYGQHHV